MIISMVLFAVLGSRMVFEEDITKLLPSTDKGGSEKLVFSNLKVKDKLFITISSLSGESQPEDMAEVCDNFATSLIESDTIYNLIDNVLYNIDEDLIPDAVSFLYDNIASFIPIDSYDKIEALLSDSAVEEQMKKNKELLVSAAGTQMSDLVRTDPVGIRNIFLPQAQSAQGMSGSDYKIYDYHFYSSDTTVNIAFVSPAFKSFDSKSGIRLIELIEEQIRKYRIEYPDMEILYHGAPAQSVFNSRQIKKDLALTLSVSMLIICIIIGICFKNRSTLIMLVAPVLYGALFALAVIYIIKGSMSLMALGIGAIVLGVALSYCLHVLTHYKYVSDPEEVLKDQTLPVILGSLTTIGSFMGLMFTQSDLLKDFGLFASLALVGTTVFSLIFLPHFFSPERNRRSAGAFRLFEKINSYPFEKNKIIIGFIMIFSVICFSLSNRVSFDSDLKNIGYNDADVMRSQQRLVAKLSDGYSSTYYAATAQSLDSAIVNAQGLTLKLDSMREAGLIKSYAPVAKLLSTTQDQLSRIEHWYNYWDENKKAEIKEKLEKAGALYGFKAVTFKPFTDLLDTEYEPVDIVSAGIIPDGILSNIVEKTDGGYMIFIPVKIRKEDQVKAGDVVAATQHCVVVDPFYYTGDMVRLINEDFNVTLGISSLFVFIVLLLSFKSLILSVIAFIPISLSWYIVLGVMAMFGLEFNLINIVISAFIFGIGVDYSIFVMDGLLSGFRYKRDLIVYHKTAILFSAIVLIVGVASLVFATHPAIASVGLSTLIGMSSAVILSYTIQPFLFNLFIKNRIEKGLRPLSLYNIIHSEKFLANNAQSPRQKLIYNYEYKGFAVESGLRSLMAGDKKLEKLNAYIADSKRIIDWGAGYGYISYWCLLNNHNSEILAVEDDSDKVVIAKNCHLNNSRLLFEDSSDKNSYGYDTLILNNSLPQNIATFNIIMFEANTLIVNTKLEANCIDHITRHRFEKVDSDKVFAYYKKM